MNLRYEVRTKDPIEGAEYVYVVWAPNDRVAVDVALDTVDYRHRIKPSGWDTSVRIVGDKPEPGDIVLKEE